VTEINELICIIKLEIELRVKIPPIQRDKNKFLNETKVNLKVNKKID